MGAAATGCIATLLWSRIPVAPSGISHGAVETVMHGERFQVHMERDERRAEPWPVSGSLRVDGRLYVAISTNQAESRRVYLHFDEVDGASLSLGDGNHRSAPDLTRLLVESWSIVTLGRDGALSDVAFPQGTPPLYADLMTDLLPRLFATVPREGCTFHRERHAFGTAVVRECVAGAANLTREVVRLETDHGGEVRVMSSGHRTVDDRLLFRAITQSELVLLDAPSGAPARARFELSVSKASDELETRALRLAPIETHDPAMRALAIERRMLEKRAAPLSGPDLVNTLERFAAAGVLPDHERFLWQATARLRLEPHLDSDLMRIFEGEQMSSLGRELVFDLLSFAGSDDAQRTMRALLDTKAAGEDSKVWLALVQRFGFVQTPSQDTVRFLADRHADAKPESDVWIATAYALGAVLRHVEDAEVRKPYLAALERELDGARSEEQRAHLLRALGNSGDPTLGPRIVRHAASTNETVRAASAAALRYIPGEETTRALVQLLGDRSVRIVREAFSSLALYPLSAADWGSVDLATKHLDPSLTPALVTFLSERSEERRVAPLTYARLLARARDLSAGEPRLEARVRALE